MTKDASGKIREVTSNNLDNGKGSKETSTIDSNDKTTTSSYVVSEKTRGVSSNNAENKNNENGMKEIATVNMNDETTTIAQDTLETTRERMIADTDTFGHGLDTELQILLLFIVFSILILPGIIVDSP